MASNMPSEPALTIASLIDRRCRELQLRPAELVRRTGYRNISKGLRRLDQLYDGDFHLARELIRELPRALEVPEHAVRSAIARDVEALANAERQAAAEREAAWRAAFRPHAIAVTARRVPSPIFAAAMSNATRYMRTELDATPSQRPSSTRRSGACAGCSRSGAGTRPRRAATLGSDA